MMRWLGLLMVMWAGAGCSQAGEVFGGHACTDIGCQDGLSVEVTGTDGDLPAGTHTLEVTADGVQSTCTFPMPSVRLTGGALQSPSCPVGMMVLVVPAETCTETRDPSHVSQTCTPIPGQYVERIYITGTPVNVRLRQSVDGVVVFDQALSPTYRASQPNGPDCEPICHQASASWTLTTPQP